ncbi:MAG: transporter substrate-binding domain-containing protein, partial [Chromatiales bacterium]|nr:transporter substrate-binding domain-containing protein [Chromatiales bacterium]
MRKEISDWMFRLVMGVIPVTGAILLTGFAIPPSTLEQIVRSGELRVATTVGPTTYYQDGQSATGFEYDLARMFADHLGVKLVVVTPDNPDDMLALVAHREVHFAAAGIS